MSGVNTVNALDPVWLRLIRLESSYSHKRRILVRYFFVRVCDVFRKIFETLLLLTEGLLDERLAITVTGRSPHSS
jgi:hypothetical protein